MSEARADDFLGGRLRIRQPVTGYRAGADPVFLAAAVSAKPGDQVLELGCGVGTALLCLAVRVEGLQLSGVERQAQLADLARQNARDAGIDANIVTADLAQLPHEITMQTFDQVLFNPPFFDRNAGSAAHDRSRETGRGAAETLNFWIETGLRRLRPGGALTLINRMERLPDTLVALSEKAGEVTVLPLQPRRLKPAKLFLLQARKGARSPFHLLPPLILHQGEAHERVGTPTPKSPRASCAKALHVRWIVNL